MTDREPLDPEVDALLAPERDPPDVPSAVQERVLARVIATRGAGGPGDGSGGSGGDPGAGTGAANAAARAARAAAVRGSILGFLLGGLAGAGVHAALSRPTAPTVVTLVTVSAPSPRPLPDDRGMNEPSPPVTPPAPSPAATASGSIDAHAPAATSAAPRAASAADAGGPIADTELAKERALIQMARTALLQGQSAAALTALDQHAREFPRGRLGEEREALAIQALAAAGRRDEARARADRFRHAHPQSILLPVVEAAVPAGGAP
jgi:hypothetical protein